MNAGIINKHTPYVDVVELLTGTWNTFQRGEFTITVTPFFTTVTATLNQGSHVLPFKVKQPVAALLSYANGSVGAAIVKPGDTAVKVNGNCIFNLQMFGDAAAVENII